MMIITMKQPVLPPTTIQPSTIQSYDTSACIPIILRPSFIYPVRRHAVQALAFNWTSCISNDVDDEDQKRKNFSRRLLTHSMDGICYKEKYVLRSVSSTLYRKSLSVRYCPLMSYMQKAWDCGDISPQIFLDFPQDFRLRTRNQYFFTFFCQFSRFTHF